ncbi:MAG: hypothetical protein COW30_14300 [Rhodospirillales bacterium CG15_BIG_FIL_POST_REV_8_21_14_020_66_15]|nr:MAG: hypothetical protein COW30_14300 [Rhodospirillales bacterium CG15_BIG_FIL_POST_REV_8_21_14_020_66_15]
MANFFVTYDLNGSHPTHQDMDDHIKGICPVHGRVLETVWYVQYQGSSVQLRDRLRTIMGSEDLLLVIEASDAAWTRLLVDSESLINAWRNAA